MKLVKLVSFILPGTLFAYICGIYLLACTYVFFYHESSLLLFEPDRELIIMMPPSQLDRLYQSTHAVKEYRKAVKRRTKSPVGHASALALGSWERGSIVHLSILRLSMLSLHVP